MIMGSEMSLPASGLEVQSNPEHVTEGLESLAHKFLQTTSSHAIQHALHRKWTINRNSMALRVGLTIQLKKMK